MYAINIRAHANFYSAKFSDQALDLLLSRYIDAMIKLAGAAQLRISAVNKALVR
ncbi:MAG: hypothetical protein ACI945_001382, partial [Pseudohongiellaceae bacterium]